MSLVNLRFKDDTTEFMFICSNVCLLYTSKSSFNTTNRRPNAIIVDKRTNYLHSANGNAEFSNSITANRNKITTPLRRSITAQYLLTYTFKCY